MNEQLCLWLLFPVQKLLLPSDEMFTFPRERHYSWGYCLLAQPHPLWEHKPLPKGGLEEVAIGAYTVATGAAICQFLGSQPASELAIGSVHSWAYMHYAQLIP